MGIKVRALPKFQYSYNGGPASGFKVYTYQPGTSTPKATYTDSTGTVPNANPVILDSNGEASIHWDGEYKVVIKTDQDVLVYTVDNYGAGEEPVLSGNYNLVTDGGFENDANGDNLPDDWTVTKYNSSTSTAEIDTSDQYEGANSLKFVSTGDGGGYAVSAFFAVQEGKTLDISFGLKCSVVDVRNTMDVLWYSSAQVLQSATTVYDDDAANPTSWEERTTTVTVPAGARFAKVRVTGCHSSDATSGIAWFDNVVIVQQVSGGAAVTGELKPYAGSSAPTGYLLCDGSAVSRATYAALYAVIGTTYGVGDGTTTFNVPDMRGRVPVGLDSMGGTPANRVAGAWADTLGGADGAETHTLVEGEIPAHTHGSTGSHTHSSTTYGISGEADPSHISGGAGTNAIGSQGTSSSGSHEHSSFGGGGAHNNMQPSLALNFIIKT